MSTVTGETLYVIRNGKKYPVIKNKGVYYYKIDGKYYKITNLATIFGLNQNTSKAQADRCHKDYKYCENKINESKAEGIRLNKAYKFAKNKLDGILAKFGVTDIKKITDQKALNQAKTFLTSITKIKFAKIRNSADIIFYAHQGTSAALNEGKYASQALVERASLNTYA